MICFLLRQEHIYTVRSFSRHWAGPLMERMRILAYEQMAQWDALPAATYVFGDLERLSAMQGELALQLHCQLRAHEPAARTVNHPVLSMRRPELLKKLHGEGINQFKAYGLDEIEEVDRFPVFIRGATDHQGNRSRLLESKDALEKTLPKVLARGHDPSQLLIVEYVDVRDESGLCRKYAAFRVGEHIAPRHMIVSDRWMQKLPDMITPAIVEEERAYLEANPHEATLRRVFDLAHIEYGRIDYGLKDGAVQVWEINTNPIIMLTPDKYEPMHVENQRWFAEKIRAAFESIDHPPSDATIPITVRYTDSPA